MKNLMKNGSARSFTVALFCCMTLVLLPGATNSFAGSPAVPATSQEMLRLGERIYREGILPSGEPLQVTDKAGLSVPGMTFACASCHLRSGLGSSEVGLFVPPASGDKLFKPIKIASGPAYKNPAPFMPAQMDAKKQKYYQTPFNRPGYTDESLAVALRTGVDSAGRIMKDVMPRYVLNDENMELLVAYLKSLSSEFSPGVSDATIRFAAIITEDISPEERNAFLVPLENFIRNRQGTKYFNPLAQIGSAEYRVRINEDITSKSSGPEKRTLSLSRWALKGPPETWRKQLEEYNRREPVFALLGGLANGEWQPIHQFCEENRIPCIFPITDFPVISQRDWYTLYFSKGYYQEGEAAARFLNDKEELKGKPIVQIVRDTREGRALSRGFEETWLEFEQKPPRTVILKNGDTLTEESLQKELTRDKPAVVVLWDGPEALKTLDLLAAGKNKPAMVLVSSSFLGKSMFSLNEQVRDFTYLTYPYGMSQSPRQIPGSSAVAVKKFSVEANADVRTRIAQQSFILIAVLDTALWDMRGNYYRDNLLDVIGTNEDLDAPLYDRLGFGQGQRYASKGCHIVQLSKTGIIKKISWMSGWATQ